MLSISLNRPFSIFILILVYDLDNITRSITIVCHDSFVYVVTYRIWQSVAWRMSYKKRKLFTHSKHHGSPWFMVGWSVLLILLVSNLCGGFCLGWRGLFSFFSLLSSFFVMCAQCCLCLWIVLCWSSLLFSVDLQEQFLKPMGNHTTGKNRYIQIHDLALDLIYTLMSEVAIQ